ncbi:hypothetical protein Misp03_24290 [Microbispora sp. NBRC 16548]|nr:hypothetical protein [Microbispora sp. NBRC 16548]GLX05502.1 hypothetical protein Misp03_24290 [Microbispora sp. NBRC 16548]
MTNHFGCARSISRPYARMYPAPAPGSSSVVSTVRVDVMPSGVNTVAAMKSANGVPDTTSASRAATA